MCSQLGKIMPTQGHASFTCSSRWICYSVTQHFFFVQWSEPKFIIWYYELLQAAALAFYILSALFFDSFVIIFVVTVVLAALDFWVVKNVSGRILVGLRWWNEINEQGESVWKFECLDQEVTNLLVHWNLALLFIFTILDQHFHTRQILPPNPMIFLFVFGHSHWLGWTRRILGSFGGQFIFM